MCDLSEPLYYEFPKWICFSSIPNSDLAKSVHAHLSKGDNNDIACTRVVYLTSSYDCVTYGFLSRVSIGTFHTMGVAPTAAIGPIVHG